jgi:hypothetical protein
VALAYSRFPTICKSFLSRGGTVEKNSLGLPLEDGLVARTYCGEMNGRAHRSVLRVGLLTLLLILSVCFLSFLSHEF